MTTPILPGSNNGHCQGQTIDTYDRNAFQEPEQERQETRNLLLDHRRYGPRLDHNGFIKDGFIAPSDEEDTDVEEKDEDEDDDNDLTNESVNEDGKDTDEPKYNDQATPLNTVTSPTAPTQPLEICSGCRDGLANQQAHMDIGGCLFVTL